MSDAKGGEEEGEKWEKKVQRIAGKWEADKYKQVRILKAGNGIDGSQD